MLLTVIREVRTDFIVVFKYCSLLASSWRRHEIVLFCPLVVCYIRLLLCLVRKIDKIFICSNHTSGLQKIRVLEISPYVTVN